ncbi:MAG: helix-turn-helix transcriptional regulator [Pirellulales bacterium]|nr:helix-turn-helix transcriptional regulator [Pirellulales bacterium]
MIAPTVVREIQRLLEQEGLSQRAVATRMGVSRGTVGSIARGRRHHQHDFDELDEDDPPPFSGPARRCPSCGRLVQMPCLACRILAMKEKGYWAVARTASGHQGEGRDGHAVDRVGLPGGGHRL